VCVCFLFLVFCFVLLQIFVLSTGIGAAVFYYSLDSRRLSVYVSGPMILLRFACVREYRGESWFCFDVMVGLHWRVYYMPTFEHFLLPFLPSFTAAAGQVPDDENSFHYTPTRTRRWSPSS
jgi:hypothetical protein